MRTSTVAGAAAAIATTALLLTGCGAAQSESPTIAKTWPVDPTGWWVPGDPAGCGELTTECKMNAWPSRAYVMGGSIPDVFSYHDELGLICKAPTPAAIRNAKKVESVHWFYADYHGTKYWVPDIYATNTDTAKMAEGVPDCPTSTPGI